MAKKNNVTIAIEGMTTRKTERVILELLNKADKRDGFTLEENDYFYVVRPIKDCPIRYIVIDEGMTSDNVTIGYNNGLTVFGEAFHMERCTEKYNAFIITDVDLPLPW